MTMYEATTFAEFWEHYDALHGSPTTRKAHAVATLSAMTLFGLAVYRRSLPLLIAAPIVDYAIAQLSHRAEGVTTEPWRHPLWHARAELRLLRRTLRARRPGGA